VSARVGIAASVGRTDAVAVTRRRPSTASAWRPRDRAALHEVGQTLEHV
jgi:hypothetical protein